MSLELTDAMMEAIRAIHCVGEKEASGEYAMEEVSCFCGALDPLRLASNDRYGLTAHTNLCQRCGLLYLSPRMNAASYRAFYDTEYRQIYQTSEDHDGVIAQENGETLYGLCEFYDVVPTRVIDLGCGEGGMLRSFLQRGCACLGVDYDHGTIARGRELGLPIEVGGAETLIARGERADLVIMHHTFEHCLDLRATLEEVRQLLTPTGVLSIAVPGIRATPLGVMFQNAHTYHFTADTLEYVMECCGWSAFALDERINSFWRYTGTKRLCETVPPSAVSNVLDLLGRDPVRLHEIKTHNKFPVKQQRENVQAVLASGLPDFSAIRSCEAGQSAIVIGGGPSIDSQVPTIQSLIAAGHRVVSIERMASWCRLHGIIPDYVVVLDASEDVPESLHAIHPDTVCITATQCGQAVVDALHGHRVYCFTCPTVTMNLSTLFEQASSQKNTVLNVGGSVTLSAMTVALALGMTTLHVFGFDCHLTDGTYAQGITGVGAQGETLEIEIDGQAFTTTGNYFSFAQQFFPLVDQARLLGFLKGVKVYGPSLVNAMGEEWLTTLVPVA